MKTHKFNCGLAFIALTVLMFASVTSLHAGAGFTTLVAFTYTNAPNYGWNSQTYNQRTCALLPGDDGNFYGTTSGGGVVITQAYSGIVTYDSGTVFKLTPDGAFTSLHSFGGLIDGYGNSLDGSQPVGNLVKGADGSLYGTTVVGGRFLGSSDGTVFRITTNGALSTIYSFGQDSGWNTNPPVALTNYDGRFPGAGIVLGRDGNFYGTTTAMGSYGWGTVFQLTPGGILTTLHSFSTPDNNSHNADGWNPWADLVEGNDGNFYGTTAHAGAYGFGTVFKITPTGTFTTLISFDGVTDGGQTLGGLVLGKDGKFYGTTVGGGSGNAGTIFQITTNGVLTTLHCFTGGEGAYPSGELIQGSDGNFYGTTTAGGASTNIGFEGTVFQLTPGGTLTTLHSFSGPDGYSPQGALVQDKDGELYGTTSYGGPGFDGSPLSGYGTIFRVTIPPTFRSITPTNGAVALTWSVTPGHTYQLQSTTNFSSPNWINFGSAVTATNSTATAFDSVTNAQCFYRIQLLP